MEYKHYQRQNDDSPGIHTIVNNIFKKTFAISGNANYKLPKPDSVFVDSPWEIKELQNVKIELNETKSKLNNYCFQQWNQHTSQRSIAKQVEWCVRREYDPELFTQAWCKFHEIVSKYPLVPRENIFNNNNKFLSLHLCEAPGAFITCLNHWLKTNLPTIYWDWLAMTFNPYYEGNSNSKMISDDRFIMHTLKNWFFGKDNTGNLMVLENLDALITKVKTKGKVSLVTADGSVNCISNPGEQEAIVASLHFCEVVAAIHVLEAGGNFLLKIFTIFEQQSICLLYFLSCIFKNIHFYKPVTSKEGNSEVYVICLDFKGSEFVAPYLSIFRKQYGITTTTAMFSINDIPDSFVHQIIACAKLFKCYQCQVIENNIAAYHIHDSKAKYEEKRIAKLVTTKFLLDFPLQKLHVDLQIVGNVRLKKVKSDHWVVKAAGESFNERKKKQALEPIYHLLTYIEQLKSFESNVKMFTFKPTNTCINLSIETGSPYDRIQNSRFCPVQIAEIYNLLFQTIDIEKNIKIDLPTKENIIQYESEMQQLCNDTYKTLHFKYTEISENNQTIFQFKQILKELEQGDNLVLFGFLSLTQFNVGLIYLLAHTFESVVFTLNNQIGCCIIFKNFKKKESILQKIQQIHEFSDSAIKNNMILLSIISVMEIYGSELYSIIVKINNSIAKYCVDYIASIYDKSKEEKIEI